MENYGQGKTKLIAYVTANKIVRTINTLAVTYDLSRQEITQSL